MTPKPLFQEIVQIGIIVRSIKDTTEKYWRDFGIGPWDFYTLNPSNVRDMTVHGNRVDHGWRTAAAKIGTIELELMEPTDDDSIYAEHLRTRGEGIHHIQFRVADYDEARRRIGAAGYQELGSGKMSGVRYNYFDTERSLAFVAEIISPVDPAQKIVVPDSTYP